MAGNKGKSDQGMSKSVSLFDIVEEVNSMRQSADPEPGSLAIGLLVREMLTRVLKSSAFKRWEIAGRMGEYLGIEITDTQLYSWSAESKEGHRFPLEYLPAFCRATGDFDLADVVIRKCGCQIVKSEEVALLELARINEAKRQLDAREEKVRRYLDMMRDERVMTA